MYKMKKSRHRVQFDYGSGATWKVRELAERERREGKKKRRKERRKEERKKLRKEQRKKRKVEKKKDGPGPVMVSDTLCPAVHILGT